MNPDQHLQQLVGHLPPPLNNLGPFLQKNNAVLCGSAAVKSFFPDDDWQPGDIDIVFPHCQPLDGYGWRHVPSGRNYSPEFYQLRLPVLQHYHYTHPDAPNIFINFIQFKGANTVEEIKGVINQYFDFDGVTMKWDGLQWDLTPEMKHETFLSREWCFRQNQLDRLVLKPRPVQKQEIKGIRDRLTKVKERGFHVVNETPVLEALALLEN